MVTFAELTQFLERSVPHTPYTSLIEQSEIEGQSYPRSSNSKSKLYIVFLRYFDPDFFRFYSESIIIHLEISGINFETTEMIKH